MNKALKFYLLGIAATVCVVAVGNYCSNKLVEREHAKIEAKTQAEIERMRRASSIVKQKLRNGDYKNSGFAQIENDFEFYKIVDQM